MISVEKALQIVLNSTQRFGVEEIPFLKSVGRVLKEEVLADRDFPPFNRVAMDGIAIDFFQFKKGQRAFTIAGIQAAGSVQITLQNPLGCMEVMTGAVLPNNTNTVIRYEDVMLENGIATITIEAIVEGQNVHARSKDGRCGDLLIHKNTVLSAAEIGVLATVGKSFVKVAKQPKVMIVSTGDELVGVAEIPLEHQIRRSNVFTLVSLLERLHISSKTAHITDDKSILKSKIKSYLKAYDVLLFSGAVSKGKYDFLPEVFEELGVEKLFHKVAQRPGKPFFYGQTNTCSVFGFPGNPISTFVNCLVYFYPWYQKSVGFEVEEETAVLGEDVHFRPNLTYFLQVKLENKKGRIVASPISGNGSGDLASLVNTDAFIQFPDDKSELKKGEIFKIIRYRKF
ncbi:molybdopterin biosynthesis; MoeA [Polaribacter irgensii 23-P]|uniref:Molybdopterin molybdenumtransferase n=1 Tax=Polaribacter irgensii 23-P TaxID=313594 RepID=A4BXK5_9FLAO|nr:molybdopterin molybdotransferase MoeA [Polaribacter irgensii]EAR13696.1 molybdopterin biosynthesis; MoeA [Polaribacter irgensii 23-P]